jgi:hypothetical protein
MTDKIKQINKVNVCRCAHVIFSSIQLSFEENRFQQQIFVVAGKTEAGKGEKGCGKYEADWIVYRL